MPNTLLLESVARRMAPNQDSNGGWRYEEAHVLAIHSVVSETAGYALVYKCPTLQQQTPESLLGLMHTIPCPSSGDRRMLAHIIATQVRSLHVHFQINHPALRTDSFVFFAATGTAGTLSSARPDFAKPYTLGWGTGTASAPRTPLTVEGMFQHPYFRAMPESERPETPPWYDQAWAMMMILTEIADWRPINRGPFRNEKCLTKAAQERVQVVTSAAWKNSATADIMRFGFSALERPHTVLHGLDNWQIKSFYDELCDKLAPVRA